MLQPFPGDGAVVLDLATDQFPYILQLHGLGKIINILHIQKAPVCHLRLLCGHDSHLVQLFPILLNQYNIRVIIGNPHFGIGAIPVQGHDHIQEFICFQGLHLNLGFLHILLDLNLLLLGHPGNHLQDTSRISCHHTCCRSSLDALEASGIGHNHTLHIFHNVTAGLHHTALRQNPQHFPGLSRTISQCNGLRTPHGRNQFFLQNLHIRLILNACTFHTLSSYEIHI